MADANATPRTSRLKMGGGPPALMFHVCRWAAISGGLLLCGLAIMLVVTIVGRKLFAWQVNGDYEIVQMFGAVATSLLFPWCQITMGNIAVDIFTARLPDVMQSGLDRLGALFLAVLASLMAWRTGILAIQSEESGSISAVLGWPVWLFQAMIVPGLLLMAIVSISITLFGVKRDSRLETV